MNIIRSLPSSSSVANMGAAAGAGAEPGTGTPLIVATKAPLDPVPAGGSTGVKSTSGVVAFGGVGSTGTGSGMGSVGTGSGMGSVGAAAVGGNRTLLIR